jgi:hypothetical protein
VYVTYNQREKLSNELEIKARKIISKVINFRSPVIIETSVEALEMSTLITEDVEISVLPKNIAPSVLSVPDEAEIRYFLIVQRYLWIIVFFV